MNNVIGLLLGITDPNNPEWKYINREGHVITCTKKQFSSYIKKGRKTHEQVRKDAIATIFAPCPMWKYFKSEIEQYGKDVCEAAEEHFFGKGKGVRKKMAIDYKKEWKNFAICYRYSKIGAGDTVGKLMNDWINATINEREELMKEYIKETIATNIEGGTKHFHLVNVYANDITLIKNLHISKANFDDWCKNKRKEVK